MKRRNKNSSAIKRYIRLKYYNILRTLVFLFTTTNYYTIDELNPSI
jgi:hypothetical protein